ncbi:MAG TPA: ribbon-helix-helix domain-containing protein [Gaiellaceae bacterium]|nr:ribbon-helix-helix domain-containing protein [Gaiellaceae bacterium]
MRMHIDMGDELVEQIDAVAGKGRRSQFVRDAVAAALEQRKRAELVLAARGVLADRGHDWDENPAEWVRAQRRGDDRRVG